MDLKAILGIVRKPTSPRSDIVSALADLNIEAAERRASGLEAKRRQILIAGDDRELAEIEDAITLANREIERTVAMREELERRLAVLDDAEEVVERQRRYDFAVASAVQARKALGRYPDLVRQIVEGLGAIAKAELAIKAANAALPSGAESLPSVELEYRQALAPQFTGDFAPLAAELHLPHIRPDQTRTWEPSGPTGYGLNFGDMADAILDRVAEQLAGLKAS